MSAMVIVGAGECGARAAAALRQGGWEGDIELLGAERHLPYERPPLSKAALLSEDAPDPVTVHDEAALVELGINHRGEVEVVDIDRTRREVVLASGERIGYERLLLATGASPRPLPMAAGFSRVHTLRTHDDAMRLRASLRSAAARRHHRRRLHRSRIGRRRSLARLRRHRARSRRPTPRPRSPRGDRRARP